MRVHVSNQNPVTTDAWLTRNLGGLLTCILAAALVITLVVIVFYAHNFPGSLLATNAEWGAFGAFVGGILGPALSFLALIGLLVTLWVQNLAMEVTRKQTAQQTDVASLSAQITAISVLVESLNEQIRQYGILLSKGGGNTAVHTKMLDRRDILLERLDAVYEQLAVTQAVS